MRLLKSQVLWGCALIVTGGMLLLQFLIRLAGATLVWSATLILGGPYLVLRPFRAGGATGRRA